MRADGVGLMAVDRFIPECSEGTPGVNRKSMLMLMAMLMLMLMMAMMLYFTLYFVKRGTTFFSRTPLVAMLYIVSWLPCGCITVVKS